MSEDFYVYNAVDIATMLEGLLKQLIEEQDIECFNASCQLIETIIFRAREQLAGVAPGHG
jgi:hypothetical protein